MPSRFWIVAVLLGPFAGERWVDDFDGGWAGATRRRYAGSYTGLQGGGGAALSIEDASGVPVELVWAR